MALLHLGQIKAHIHTLLLSKADILSFQKYHTLCAMYLCTMVTSFLFFILFMNEIIFLHICIIKI